MTAAAVLEAEAAASAGFVIPDIDYPSIPRGQVTQSLVSKLGEIFDKKGGFLAKYNIDRADEIELCLISLLAGLDPLLLGPPGTGKTWLIELLLRALGLPKDALFNYMVFKESSADDVLGNRSLVALKQDKIRRMTAGMLPEAVVGYLDEVFKCSPTMANALLDLYAQRKLKVGGLVIVCKQLLCIFHSSNELPDREDLGPFRDRIGLTKLVAPVRTPEDRMRVMRIQDEHQARAANVPMDDVPTITLDDLFLARAETARMPMSETAFQTLDKAVEMFTSAGHEPSSRRVGQMILAMKAKAYSRGADEVSTDDIIVAQYMGWNLLDHMEGCRDIVMKFANEFARKAARTREALEPILTDLEKVKQEIGPGGEPTDEHMESTFLVMRDLRRMRKETKEQIDQGTQQGHSVEELEKVLDEINGAYSWIERTMSEDDE